MHIVWELSAPGTPFFFLFEHIAIHQDGGMEHI
jgi:hypothetical protein